MSATPPPFLRLGLTGYPIAHSLSPLLHLAALRAASLPGEYRLYPVPPLPQGEGQLRALLEGLRAPAAIRLHGLNVTIPHKQVVLALLDDLTRTARAVGAVNTLWFADGLLMGENTDVAGFWQDFEQCLRLDGWDAAPAAALLIGAGGAARAVAYALISHGWQVALAARRLPQARRLADDLNHLGLPGEVIPLRLNAGSLANWRHARALINATPLGMAACPQDCPYPSELPLPENALVYDLVYHPPETPLLRRARAQSLRGFNGLGMLIEQARLAFVCWSGFIPPREALWKAIQKPEGER
ncbi:MAG: shikimate dehydrogenase [Chloroflexota bacterium]|jgi:shikimate dehydrogenase